MGSFSWLKADTLTKVANIVQEEPFKMLIPAKFGGGFIADYYRDYGEIYDMSKNERRAKKAKAKQGVYDFDYSPNVKKYDMYELLAFWNWNHKYGDSIVLDYLVGPLADTLRSIYSTKKEIKGIIPLKQKDGYTNNNRDVGISIGCYNSQIDALDYPLKLVSYSYQGSYEQCKGRSYGDPEQGFSPLYRDNCWRIKYGCHPPKEEYNIDIPILDEEDEKTITIPENFTLPKNNDKKQEIDNTMKSTRNNYYIKVRATFTPEDKNSSNKEVIVEFNYTTPLEDCSPSYNEQLSKLISGYKTMGYNMTKCTMDISTVEAFEF